MRKREAALCNTGILPVSSSEHPCLQVSVAVAVAVGGTVGGGVNLLAGFDRCLLIHSKIGRAVHPHAEAPQLWSGKLRAAVGAALKLSKDNDIDNFFRPQLKRVSRSRHLTSQHQNQESNEDHSMKKQIKPTLKAHLLRVAFYLLLLLAACAIPFALAQRNVATRNKAKASPVSEFPVTSNAAAAPAIAVSVIPPIPAAPAVILYDQMDNPAPTPPPPPS